MDLRVEEVLVDPQLAQPGEGVVVVVAAGDRLQDAPLVEGPQRRLDARAQPHLVPLGQNAFP